MARYISSFTIAISPAELLQSLGEILPACNFEIIYATNDYLMAREIPGDTSFAKLVVVEVLIDKTVSTNTETRVQLVIKNEELPLHVNNHCYQMFQLVNQAIVDYRQWQLVDYISG